MSGLAWRQGWGVVSIVSLMKRCPGAGVGAQPFLPCVIECRFQAYSHPAIPPHPTPNPCAPCLQVGPRRFSKSHPFAGLTSTENIVSFTTSRYCNPSLIVRGPGAGPAITAAGVFGDIITLARYMGAHS